MGRRKGSKNKPKPTENIVEVKRKRGRPRKNPQTNDLIITKQEDKQPTIMFGNERDLKREIRQLKKLKLQCRAGSKERIELYRKIKELKLRLTETKNKKDNATTEDFSSLKLIGTHPHAPLLTEEEINTKYADDNGCMYFNICKKEQDTKGKNVICFHPKYFIEKINRKCIVLNNEEDI